MNVESVAQIQDREFEEKVIDEVFDWDEETWNLVCGRGHITAPKREGVPVRPGMMARFYGAPGMGVRGIAVEGKVLYYYTPQEARENHARYVERMQAEQREAARKSRPDRDRRIAALPFEFQARLRALAAKDLDFELLAEPYELAVYEQAVLLARHFKTVEALDGWWNSSARLDPFEGFIPEIMGYSTHFARLYLQDPALLLPPRGQ